MALARFVVTSRVVLTADALATVAAGDQAIGIANLRAYAQGTDDVGHAAISN